MSASSNPADSAKHTPQAAAVAQSQKPEGAGTHAGTPATNEDLSQLIGVSGQGSRRFKSFLWLLLLVVVVVATGWWWYVSRGEDQSGPMFVTEGLKRGNISLSVTATGNLEPTNEVTIGSELSGTVQEVFVEANDHVTEGQPLLKLDTSKLEQQTQNSRASVASAQARVLQAQATLEEVEATLGRQEELHRLSDGKLPSRADMASAVAAVARARADLEVARAGVGSAEAQLMINESDLSKALIRSPIDGIVLTRSIEPGQTVAASFTAPELFVIAEKLEHMKLKVAIAESDIGRLEDDQRATFSVDAWPGRGYKARVVKVSYGSKVTDNVVTYETELEVNNDDLSLRPGMTATAQINVAGATDVFLVPAAALRFEPPVQEAEPAAAASQNQTLVDMLVPQRRRPIASRTTRRGSGGTSVVTRGRIWVLERDENGAEVPKPIEVSIGISDGRNTEVSADALKEGMRVIQRLNVNNAIGARR